MSVTKFHELDIGIDLKCLQKSAILSGAQVNEIGSGRFGKVLEVCRGSECKYAVKVVIASTKRQDARFQFEVDMQQRYGSKVIEAFRCTAPDNSDVYGFIIMERLDKSFLELKKTPGAITLSMVNSLYRQLYAMWKDGYAHRDVRLANVMWKRGGRPCVWLIDFGMAASVDDQRDQTRMETVGLWGIQSSTMKAAYDIDSVKRDPRLVDLAFLWSILNILYTMNVITGAMANRTMERYAKLPPLPSVPPHQWNGRPWPTPRQSAYIPTGKRTLKSRKEVFIRNRDGREVYKSAKGTYRVLHPKR